MAIEVSSPAFAPNQRIPTRYTRDGENLSPPLRWRAVPPGTAEIAILVDDPDAPSDEPFVHWVAHGIEPSATGVEEGAEPACEGRNSFKNHGYDGPAPPRGHGVHHYHFHVYALDTRLPEDMTHDKAGLLAAMQQHVLDAGEIVGTYER